MPRKIVAIICLFFFSYGLCIPIAHAQSTNAQAPGTLGVATMVQTKDKDVKDGSVLSNAQNGAILSNVPYDSQVLGVVSRDAAIIINGSNSPQSVPVISTGQVYILVSSKDGAIKKGDLLTTSTMPGVAVKATKTGYILGIALEDDSNPDPKQVDKIAANLDLHYFNSKSQFPGTLSDILKLAMLSTSEGPAPIFKDIVAAIVVLGSFILGFLTFGRTAAKGVEALGRNPAASRMIHLGIIFNVGIVVVIVFAGMTIAFLILRL